jgi:membrane fusion protein (multidrug efflux system)
VSEDGSVSQTQHDEEKAPRPDAATDPGPWPAIKKWAIRIVPLTLVVLAAAYLGPKLIYSFSHESTDDAYVAGTIVPISAQVAGRVTHVWVIDHQHVRRGQPLVEIDSTDFRNALQGRTAALSSARAQRDATAASIEEQRKVLASTRANLEAARSEAALADSDRHRYAGLLEAGSISPSEFDHKQSAAQVAGAKAQAAEAAVQQARATLTRLRAELKVQEDHIDQARTDLDQARTQLGRTTVVAPADGVLAQKDVDPGQVIQAGQPLMQLVREDSMYVDANFKETQLHDIRLGDEAEVDIDAYPGVTFEGHVGSFQPGAGAVFSLLPPENATGNFVKVVRRVPVKIWIDSPPDSLHPLWPGLSAEPHVETGSAPARSPTAAAALRERRGG